MVALRETWLGLSAALLLFIVGCSGNGGPPPPSRSPGQAGELACDRVYSHDAGILLVSPRDPGTLTHEFIIPNPSKSQQMELKVHQTACGCTIPKVGPPRVEPGGLGRVTVSVELRPIREWRREIVILTTGLAQVPRIGLVLNADVYPRLYVGTSNPLTASLLPGERAVFKASAVAYRPAEEAPEELQLALDCQGGSIRILERKTEWVSQEVRKVTLRFAVKIRGPAPAEVDFRRTEFAGTLKASYGNDEVSKPVQWHLRPWIQARPRELFLSAGPSGSQSKDIELAAEEPFGILAIEAEDPAIVAQPLSRGRLRTHTVRVFLAGGSWKDLASRRWVTVRTDRQEQPLVQVAIYVFKSG
ncbi:MAG: hypothetical protein ACUVUC_07005 [Thermoguttaceae bacterium]